VLLGDRAEGNDDRRWAAGREAGYSQDHVRQQISYPISCYVRFVFILSTCLSVLLCCVAISESTNSYRLPKRLPTIAQFQQMKKKNVAVCYSTHAPIQVLLSRDPRSSCVCRRKKMATVESKENRRDRPGWWSFHML
jgi:hypothetical protein